MSIKPKFFEKILSGDKKVEYRKVSPKHFEEIYLYVSYPIKKILGKIILDKIVIDSPEKIWSETKNIGGIDKTYFFEYSKNKKTVSAIFIKKVIVFDEPLKIEGFKPPQNYLFKEYEEFSDLD